MRIVAALSIPMFIIILVILFVWVYEARKNLESFRAGPFRFSPGLAVGSFLIPIANLWLPYLVLQEIWKGGDPGLPPFSPEPFGTRRGSRVVVVWWVAFLLNDLFAVAVTELLAFTRGDLSLSHFRVAAELHIASNVIGIVSAALTAVLAYHVLRRQEALRLQVAPRADTPRPVPSPATGLPPWVA